MPDGDWLGNLANPFLGLAVALSVVLAACGFALVWSVVAWLLG